MSPNQKHPYRQPRPGGKAQSFDIAPPKKTPKQQNFPAVGMTLNSYSSKTNGGGGRRTGGFQVQQQPKRWRNKIPFKRIGLAIVALLIIAGLWLGWKFIYNAHKLFGGSVFSALTVGKLNGESTGRVNILLAGNSADDPGHQGGNLTDSIMILSVSTKDNTAMMISVPRDLYVSVPGYKTNQKINTAYPTGQASHFSESGYAQGGMGLLEKIIQRDLGITCQYYALVNYNALRDAVNSVGGVDITVNSSDPRGLYDPSRDYATHGILVKLSNGPHHLSGQQALDLARARGDARGSYGFANSDFDRTAHQRQLILAIRSKATSAGVLSNPIKLGKLFDSVGKNVTTDLTLSNARRLYDITKSVPSGSIQSVGLNSINNKQLLKGYTTPRGESALIPAAGVNNFSDIKQTLRQLMSSDPLVRENAQLVVLNGTDTSGLAAHEAYVLTQKNFNVLQAADADSHDHQVTQIIDLTKGTKPGTLKALLKQYSGSTSTQVNPYGTKFKADFIIVVGADRAQANAANNN